MSTQVIKVWWDGEKLMAEPIPESEIYRESAQQQDDPCPGCRKGVVCRTPKCGRLNLPIDHPCRAEQPAQRKPCPTCEALARAVMLDQTSHDQQRQPLTDEVLEVMWDADTTSNEDCKSLYYFKLVARAVEAAHGIGGKA